MRLRSMLFLCAACLVPSAASASTLTVTESTLATGSIGGTQFLTPTLVTFTVVGDSSAVTFNGSIFVLPAMSATTTVAGVGTFAIADTVYAYNNESHLGSGYLGIFDDTTKFLISTNDPSLATYGFNGAIGPLSSASEHGDGRALNLSSTTYTNLNLFTYTDSTLQVTTNGVTSPTPEPSSLALLATGALSLTGLLRRRGA